MNTTTIALGIALGVAATTHGETGVHELRLWEGVAVMRPAPEDAVYEGRGDDDPPNRWLHGVTDPVATLYEARPDRATGAAVVVFPGGGYGGQAIDKEGHFVGRWLAERGVTALVTSYRCGGGKHRHPAPLMDGQRAVRLLRSQADRWGVDPGQIGVMGFSAGGHLAATVATHTGAPHLLAEDPLGGVSARPDFAVLVYPVISMREGITHGGSRQNLLGGAGVDERLTAQLSADEQVSEQTPPSLLIHSVDDGAVPVANSQRYFDACLEHGVPAEMHLYETGGHGYGMWATEGSVATWPAVLEGWLVGKGWAVKAE